FRIVPGAAVNVHVFCFPGSVGIFKNRIRTAYHKFYTTILQQKQNLLIKHCRLVILFVTVHTFQLWCSNNEMTKKMRRAKNSLRVRSSAKNNAHHECLFFVNCLNIFEKKTSHIYLQHFMKNEYKFYPCYVIPLCL